MPSPNDEFEKLKKRKKYLEQEVSEETTKFPDFETSLPISAEDDDFNSEINTPTSVAPTLEDAFPARPNAETIAQNKAFIKESVKNLNEKLGTEAIKSIADKKTWKSLFDHFNINFDNYVHDGKLSIELHGRYFMCCYIVTFLPAEIAIAYPAAWSNLIPDYALKLPIVHDALTELRIFQEFVKEKGEHEFLVTFYLGRKNALIDDLKFLLRIPILLFTNIEGLIAELFDFEFRSDGYEEFKKKVGKIEW